MSERRAHWDDSLVEAVIHAISDNYDYEYRAYAVIAAVEDWQSKHPDAIRCAQCPHLDGDV